MANSVELKSRGYENEMDANDPLMELSRIIGLTPFNAPQAKAPDPQLSIEDSFALDLERELTEPEVAVDLDFGDELLDAVNDDLEAAMDLGEHAPSVEPSLEDELSALLGDDEPQAVMDATPAAPEVALPAFSEEELFEELSADTNFGAAEPVAVEAEYEPEMAFESEDWLDMPLEASTDDVQAEPDQEYSLPIHDDPVFSEMTRPLSARENGAYVAPELSVPEYVSAFDDPADEQAPLGMPELDTDFELEATIANPEAIVADEQHVEALAFDEQTLEQEIYDPVMEMADLESAELEDYSTPPDLKAGNATAFKPEQGFEQLLARTAPQPVVEPVDSFPDAIDAVEEFDIPDFEFEPEPVAGADSAFGLEDDFAEVAAPASTWKEELPPVAANKPADDDFDFDSIVDEELAVAADSGSNLAGYTGAMAAAGAGYTVNRAAAPHPNPIGLDPDLDIFREDTGAGSYQDIAPPKRNWMAAAAVVGAIVVAGAGALWAFSGSPTTTADGNVALVKADPEPVKIAPENPGGKVVANQDKAVYDKVSGQQEALPNGGQLVSESEEPLDIAAATPAEAETGKSEARVDPNGTVEAASGQAVDTLAIAPKKVKTFIVKPDGTLVERPAEVAPVVEQATAPVAPAETVAAVEPTPAPAEPVAAAPETVAEAPKPVETAVAATEPVVAPAEPEAPVAAQPAEPAIKVVKTKKIKAPVEAAPVEEVAASPAASDAPIAERPAEQPVDIVGQTGGQQAQEQQVASLDPAAAQTAAGGYSIQIASTPSPEAAKATYAALTRKYGNVISGRGVNILKADVEGKGTVYRVRIPAGSKAEANSLCAKYKSAGGSCFVSK